MHEQCRQCDARCCRYFCLHIDTPETYEQFDQVRWYLLHEGSRLHIDEEGDWWLLINTRCRWLEESPEGPKCGRYDDRPLICREFDPDNCEFAKGSYQPVEQFDTADQLDAYARATLGDRQFAAERRRCRKQVEERRDIE